MTDQRFRWYALAWLCLLIGFIALFPFLLVAFVKMTNCKGIGGACGAVAVVFGVTVKPLGVLASGIFILTIAWRRLRRLEMSHLWAASVFLWFFASSMFLVGVGNFWGANFTMGLPGARPVVFLFLLVFTLFLALASEREPTVPSETARIAWIVVTVSAIHSFLLSLDLFLNFAIMVLPWSTIDPVRVVIWKIQAAAQLWLPLPRGAMIWMTLAVFTGALVTILVEQRRHASPAHA
jgi:hypothetical protein